MNEVSREKLSRLYHERDLSTYQISERIEEELSPRQIYTRLEHHNIDIRSKTEAARLRQGKDPDLRATENFLYILGCLVGDGHVTEGGHIRFNVTERKFAESFRSALEAENFNPPPIRRVETRHADQFSVDVKSWKFKSWLDSQDEDGYSQKILSYVSGVADGRELSRPFIKGLFESDGTNWGDTGSGRTVRIVTTDQKVAETAQELIRKLGYNAHTSTWKHDSGEGYNIDIRGGLEECDRFIADIDPCIKGGG